MLGDCAALVAELGDGRLPVGIGLCELVDLTGRPTSADTIDWRGVDPAAAIDAPRVVVESDLRAAALAEARFGSGAGVSPFLFAIVGTGASACLVVDGRPYAGGRGEAVVLGAPPVEAVASGTALARAAGLERAEDVLADPALAPLVDAAATALGGALAVLANALDPSLVVLGGGLGAQRGFSERVERVCQSLLAYPRVPRFPSSAPRSARTAAWSEPLSWHSATAIRLRAVLDGTGLWRDVEELPSSVEATLADTTGLERVAALLGGDSVRRIVASGNGASYYVAVALWLASLEGRERAPEVVAVPSGLLARGAFAWRPGDALLVVSSSGEFRDLVEAIDGGAPTAYAAVTANGGSTLGSRAAARALVSVPNQRALTHTQAFCGAVAAALAVWAKVTSDPALEASLRSLPSRARADASPRHGPGWTPSANSTPRSRSCSAADRRGRRRSRRRCCSRRSPGYRRKGSRPGRARPRR